MSLPPLPKLEPSTFRWHPCPTDASITQRLANGTEAWVGIKAENARGQYDNYMNTTLRVADGSSLTLDGLKDALAIALVDIRFEHPDIAGNAVWGLHENPSRPYIQYASPKDNADALAWAQSRIETLAGPDDGLVIRAERETKRSQVSAKSFSIFLAANVSGPETAIPEGTRVDMLIHLNHIYWDGISDRQFVGDLLTRLPKALAEQELGDYKWGQEVSNLAVPLLDALKIDVEALGTEFEETRGEFIDSLIKSGGSWGLTVKNAVGTPRTEFYTLSKEDSGRIINAIKTRLGPQYTISHLGHAATVLALLKAKPLPADTLDRATLITPLPVNGRRFLRDEHALHRYGACQAGAVVDFDKLKPWVIDESDSEAVKSVMGKGCKHIKESYDYWLEKEFQLALGVSKDNFLSGLLSTTPTRFTGSSIPIFITDGLVDRYVPGEVVSKNGDKLIDVENCVFFLDTYMADLLIRMDSWKGATSLSLCFNDGFFSVEDAKAFLSHIGGFMLQFAQ